MQVNNDNRVTLYLQNTVRPFTPARRYNVMVKL